MRAGLILRYCAVVASGRERVKVLSGGDRSRSAVILVHGLLHRGVMMEPMARFLQSRGRRSCVLYDYRTSRRPVPEQGARFARFLRRMLDEYGRVELVTHSMGGLLARCALAELTETERPRIGRCVFLAPPNHGSPAATRWCRALPFAGRLVAPLPELCDTAEAAVFRLPMPEGFEIGVIAGFRDRKVPAASTRLAAACDHVTVDAGHSFMMDVPEVRRQTLFFLQNGHFDRE